MCKYNMTFSQAFNLTKKNRPIVFPNYSFILQLKVLDELNIEDKKLFIN